MSELERPDIEVWCAHGEPPGDCRRCAREREAGRPRAETPSDDEDRGEALVMRLRALAGAPA